MNPNAVWMVCKNEEFYIDMALQSVIDHVKGVYILDTGSTDKTLSIIQKFGKKYHPDRVHLDQNAFGSPLRGRGGPTYREAEARNYAMDRCIEVFGPLNYLIQLDADEIFSPYFFKCLDFFNAPCFVHSTDLPTSPSSLSDHHADKIIWQDFDGIAMFDPHVRAWKADMPVRWVERPGEHVIPRVPSFPDYLMVPGRVVIRDHVHFHLHRAFGPKSIATYMVSFRHAYEGAAEELGIPIEEVFNQKYFEDRWPEWFNKGKFNPNPPKSWKTKEIPGRVVNPLDVRKTVPYMLPDYVAKRWKTWGGWLTYA